MFGQRKLPSALESIERLTANGEEVRAADDTSFAALLEADPNAIDPATVIARRRKIEETLGSGAIHLITVECFTEPGINILKQSDRDPVVARAASSIQANRSFELHDLRVDSQHTELLFEFGQNNSIKNTTPTIDALIDPAMAAETQSDWQRWGLALEYQADKQGGRFGVSLLPNMKRLVATRLARLEQ